MKRTCDLTPQYFAVRSASGELVGVWEDEQVASDVLSKHPGGAITPLAEAANTLPAAKFQDRIQPWMLACFGPEISADRLERGDRLLEEALELLQSGDYPKDRVDALVSYVWSRPKGEPAQEIGGVMVTLAAYCLAHDIDMHEAGDAELARIWTKVDKIRAKWASKPTGGALTSASDAAQ